MNLIIPTFILPIYRMRLNPHYVFHWMCHSLGIFLVEGKYGRFLRFPNSIHLHYSFVNDPLKVNSIFIAYLFYVIQTCIQQQIQTEKCECYICNLYIYNHNSNTNKLQRVIQYHMQRYIEFLNQQGRHYTDPLFLEHDFGLNNQIPDGIVYPYKYPVYTLSVS